MMTRSKKRRLNEVNKLSAHQLVDRDTRDGEMSSEAPVSHHLGILIIPTKPFITDTWAIKKDGSKNILKNLSQKGMLKRTWLQCETVFPV
jgi:hypothetical protein